MVQCYEGKTESNPYGPYGDMEIWSDYMRYDDEKSAREFVDEMSISKDELI